MLHMIISKCCSASVCRQFTSESSEVQLLKSQSKDDTEYGETEEAVHDMISADAYLAKRISFKPGALDSSHPSHSTLVLIFHTRPVFLNQLSINE